MVAFQAVNVVIVVVFGGVIANIFM